MAGRYWAGQYSARRYWALATEFRACCDSICAGGGGRVEEESAVGMRSEDRCGHSGRDFAVERIADGGGFAIVGACAEDRVGSEYLADGHGDGPCGHVVERVEPPLARLLTSACVVELDEEVRTVGLEVGGGVVEREMPVLADPDERDVDGLLADAMSHLVADGLRVARIAGQEVHGAQGHFRREALCEVLSEARRMVGGQSDVLVQVEQGHA